MMFRMFLKCLCMGRLLLLLVLSVLFLPVLKAQMPSRRDPTHDTIQQLLASQTQLMQMMAQFMQNTTNNNNNPPPPPPPPPPPQVDRLARFLRLRPNKFSTATEPIIADDWLRSVNKDLITCECTDAEKIRFTTHLLEGPAFMWWETF